MVYISTTKTEHRATITCDAPNNKLNFLVMHVYHWILASYLINKIIHEVDARNPVILTIIQLN